MGTTSRFTSSYKKGPRLIFRSLMKGCWTPDDVVPMGNIVKKPDEYDDESEEENGSEESPLNSLPEDLWLECLARVPRSSLQTSMMVCRKWRHTLKSGEFYEVRRKIGMVENLLFVFGGAGTGLAGAVYCKSFGGWKAGLLCTIQALQENDWLLHYHNADHCLLNAQPAVVKHRIFVLGAVPSRAAVGERECTIVYDAWTKALTRGAPMIHPRKKFACCVIDDKIYVSGGCNREEVSREVLTGAEEYDPELDVWRPLPNMPRKRYGCLGAAVNGIFYVIGGLKFSSVQPGLSMQPYAYVGSMDSYNPKTNSWYKTKNMPMGGCVIACTVVRSSIYMLSSLAVELSFWKLEVRLMTFYGEAVGKAEALKRVSSLFMTLSQRSGPEDPIYLT
ncbi:hypothetical protein R1sor_017574 [Riccia sorocarpa]|uniref:F-box domain-containing protein n=1 Tax=Riccia sorocarpa TaxID=122646 RepID=A0ABD3IBA3_9MARC